MGVISFIYKQEGCDQESKDSINREPLFTGKGTFAQYLDRLEIDFETAAPDLLAQKAVEYYNSTLRPEETPREFVRFIDES